MKYNTYYSEIALTAGGGTYNCTLENYIEHYFVTGEGILLASWVIQADPAHTPVKGMVVKFFWTAGIIIDSSNTIHVFGQKLTQEQAKKNNVITCIYNGSSWDVFIVETFQTTDFGVSGVQTIHMPAIGGTFNLIPGISKTDQIIVGSPTTLTNNVTIGVSATATAGDRFRVRVDGGITVNRNTVTIFGLVVDEYDCLYGGVLVDAIYDGSNWKAIITDPDTGELLAITTGAGLSADGSYSADATTNYLKAEDFADAGLAESLKSADKLLDAQIKLVADDKLIPFDVTLTHAQILTGNSVPVDLIVAAGAGQIVIPVFYVVYLYSTGTAYVTNTDLSLYYQGAINIQTLTAFLANTAVTVATSEISSAVGDLVNKKIYVQVDTADPTGGVVGQYVRIKGYYKVISVL
jgi:hypothetical protein